MGDKTGISWTDATWNPVTGCTKVSAGCKHCYAERVFPRAYAGQMVDTCRVCNGKGCTKCWGKGTIVPEPRRFTDVMTHTDRLDQPLRWRRPRRVFVNSMSDLFHDAVPEGFIDQVFAVMARAPRHTFQILTKRPERLQQWMRLAGSRVAGRFWLDTGRDMPDWPLPNVWIGVSVEDPSTLWRADVLRQTAAAVRFISYEPALAGVDFRLDLTGPRIDWIIVGGESGPKARPFDVEWARETIRQCREAGVPVFVKQLGAHPVFEGAPIGSDWIGDARDGTRTRIVLKHRAGADIDEWPADLRVQESPSIGQGCQ